MSYKPLLLALTLCFATPAFSAPDTPKSKTAVTKKSTNNKETASKNNKKTAASSKTGKTAEKAPARSKPAATKNSKDDNKKNTQTAKSKAADKKAADKNEPRKAAAKPANKTAGSKATPTRKEPAQAAKNKTEQNKAKNTKAANDKNTPNAKKTAAANQAKNQTQAKPKAAENNNRDTPELRAALTAATNDLEAKQSLHKRTGNFLVRVNGNLKELQQARSNLGNINRQQRNAWDKLQKLSSDLNRLKTEVSNTRAQVSRFVSGHYKNNQPNAVALFLKNAEPGQKTRFLRYTRYINRSNEDVVKKLAQQQKELSAQEAKITRELAHLKRLQANAQAALKKQGAKNTAEQVESRRQNNKMAQEAKKAVKQQDNEKRLNTLLTDLDKQKAEQRKKEAEARKKAAEARLAAAEKARKKAEQERAALSNLTDDDKKLKAPAPRGNMTVSNPNSFSRLQGRLKKPVSGMLTGLFGQQRANGNLWKGVFYQTSPAGVSSLAAGNVSYAGELEGYGKVVIVDHGEGYTSVYSGLSDTGVSKGYSVGAGHPIGTSGKLPDGEEGLYLEIRYKGQNMNPLSWID
ncbi:peptidoglycan DD-metalloendopeptidase family protein [Neisseria animalis]|uniref:M23ase beta-sheet core domain-containing protein n=1 Tax=Neisseria animalis TaxID=492 RepID=A0A5P3MTF2_NEIAN|nr:peptidoglycan DD-metalloendopeptidase family protein [Neisseria animalis]QEY24883.1 hypothetical protein D0T90_10720 [Neisseria animalis]ROW32519.1 hypothetical protein CGZ60_04675 [Neisseria animalis]VEE08085.1 putative metallopeptidase [Neisseria animalis]